MKQRLLNVEINYSSYLENNNAEICTIQHWDVKNKRGTLSSDNKSKIYIDSNAFGKEFDFSLIEVGGRLKCLIVPQDYDIKFKCLEVHELISWETNNFVPSVPTFDSELLYWNIRSQYGNGTGQVKLSNGQTAFLPGFLVEPHEGLLEKIMEYQARLEATPKRLHDKLEKPILKVQTTTKNGKLQVKQIFSHSFQENFKRNVHQDMEEIKSEPVIVQEEVVPEVLENQNIPKGPYLLALLRVISEPIKEIKPDKVQRSEYVYFPVIEWLNTVYYAYMQNGCVGDLVEAPVKSVVSLSFPWRNSGKLEGITFVGM
jgi:hypothetical protein